MHGRGAAMGYRIQGAWCRWSARRVGDAASVCGIVRKNDCAIAKSVPCRDVTQVSPRDETVTLDVQTNRHTR